MPHTPTLRTLERRAAALDAQPLRQYLLEELRYGHGRETMQHLGAALEGLCGIPAPHRDTATDPLTAAGELCRAALAALAPWWDVDKRAGLALKVRDCRALDRLLLSWISWRATARYKQKLDAAERIRYADGRPFSLEELQQLRQTA